MTSAPQGRANMSKYTVPDKEVLDPVNEKREECSNKYLEQSDSDSPIYLAN